jgi:hypothetical protein
LLLDNASVELARKVRGDEELVLLANHSEFPPHRS